MLMTLRRWRTSAFEYTRAYIKVQCTRHNIREKFHEAPQISKLTKKKHQSVHLYSDSGSLRSSEVVHILLSDSDDMFSAPEDARGLRSCFRIANNKVNV